jgi:CDP-diacylglycerol--serine O-phosphatidyltransferase
MKHSKLKHLPNLITFCNMAIGILILLLLNQKGSILSTNWACYSIYIAVILDVLDGFFARYLNASTKLGKQLDSFADFISFGIAPIAIFLSTINKLPGYMMVVLLLYPLAGAFRLARHNMQEDDRRFTGLPITVSGFIMATVLLINNYLNSEPTIIFITFYLVLMLALSILMVSSFTVNRILKSDNFCVGNNDLTNVSNSSI